jgi:hypothetical protein
MAKIIIVDDRGGQSTEDSALLFSAGPLPGGLWPITEVLSGDLAETALEGGEEYEWTFDLTTLPNNALAIVQFALVAFRTQSGNGGVGYTGNALAGAYRDNFGLLTTNASAWSGNGFVIDAAGSGSIVQITSINALDNNTLGIEITADPDLDASIIGRWSISFVQSSVAIDPPEEPA